MYAQPRSMNAELAEGATDGKYKKVLSRERGGFVNPDTQTARADLYDPYYGIHEVNPKVLPDARVRSTPNYVLTPRAAIPGMY